MSRIKPSTKQPARILVTGVGALIGQGIVSSLRQQTEPVYIVGLDRNPFACQRHHCDEFIVKHDENNLAAYLTFLKRLIIDTGVQLIIPGIEEDMRFFNRHRDSLMADSPAQWVLNTPELIALGDDKWLTFQALKAARLPTIPTLIPDTWEACLEALGTPPFLYKPRQGSGSRGHFQLEDATDFAYWQHKAGEQFMVQRLVGSAQEEYTVGVFGWGDGSSTRPCILKRELGPGGATWRAETVSKEPAVEDFVERLNQHFHPQGPTNYQFRKEHGQAYLLEINPRFSSTTSLRTAFGYNESSFCLDYYLNGLRSQAPILRSGRAMRYFADEVEWI